MCGVTVHVLFCCFLFNAYFLFLYVVFFILFDYCIFYIIIYSCVIDIYTIDRVFISAFLVKSGSESVCFLKLY
jgi:hypothetical protein